MRIFNSQKIMFCLIAGIFVVSLANPFVGRVSAADEITVTYPFYAFVEDESNPWETVYDALDATGTINYSDD
uniref:hypothetical protein n=1 Tax=Syntrophomonas wolfei TaxID=863 RepID=UPI000B050117